ncbi:MAG: replicative DNA helicase [Fuerstiella sp.]
MTTTAEQLLLPPQNLDAERGVLGSILMVNEFVDAISDTLKPDHFYRDAHQKIYAAIGYLYENNVRGIDGIVLASEMERRDQLEDVGGATYIGEILDAVPHAAHVRYYARIVLEMAHRRKAIYAANEMLTAAYDLTTDIEAVIADVESTAASLRHVNNNEQRLVADILIDTFSDIEKRMASDSGIAGLSTGFHDLDVQISGLVPSDVLILAARPSMGKTALVANIAANVAPTHPVLFFSLEQSDRQLTERLISSAAHVNGHDLRNGNINAQQRDKLFAAAGGLSELKLRIDSRPKRTMQDIAAICRKHHRQEPLGVVIIDYLQLITPASDRAPREQQVATIARSLKILAKDLDVPVIALAQLNRGVENREDKRPRLADLRESGAIEQDADVVIFLHRPDAYDPEKRPGEAELIVAKNRSGPTGLVRLTWRKEFMRFENYSPIADSDFDHL